MDYKAYIAQKLNIDGMSTEEIASAIAVPPDSTMGDYALPCFKFAKLMRKSPVMIADALKSDFVCDDVISEVSAVNGYLNFRINKPWRGTGQQIPLAYPRSGRHRARRTLL